MSSEAEDWLLGTASRLTGCWRIALEGDPFPWYGFRHDLYNESSLNELRNLLDRVDRCLEVAARASAQVAYDLGVDAPMSLSEADILARVAELQTQGVRTEGDWIRRGNGANVARLLTEARAKHAEARDKRRALEERQGKSFLEQANKTQIGALETAIITISNRLGVPIEDHTGLADVLTAGRWVCDLHQRLPRIGE